MHFADFEVEQILNKAKRRDPSVKKTQMATKCFDDVVDVLDRKLEKAWK